MKNIKSWFLLGSILLSGCGQVASPIVTQTDQRRDTAMPLLSTQGTITEQQQVIAIVGILGSVGWITANNSNYAVGPVLLANVRTVLTEMITDSMYNGDGLDEAYLSLMDATELNRLAEVYLTMEGTAQALAEARASLGQGDVFRRRMIAVTSVVLQEKSNQKRGVPTLAELMERLTLVDVGTPQPPKPGDDCDKGFEKNGDWNDPSTLEDHTLKHGRDFELFDSGIASQKSYSDIAKTLFQRAVIAKGKGFDILIRGTDIIIGEGSVTNHEGKRGRIGVYTSDGGARSAYYLDEGTSYKGYLQGEVEGKGATRNSGEWYKGQKGKINDQGKCE